MTIIDAHLHVWDPGRAEYPWLGPALAPIDRTIRFEEIEPDLVRHGVTGVVLVQAADNSEDTANMFAVADSNPLVVGVVAWVPLDEPDRASAELERLRAHPRLVGIRALVHDRADPDWILRPDVDDGLGVLEAAGVPFDFVTAGRDALAHLPVIAERHPSLSIVLDHLGKPPMDEARSFERWKELLAECAAIPRLSAKLSGLYGPASRVREAADAALELFGPERLMYGSDWPMSEVAGGRDLAWESALAALSGISGPDRNAVLSGTATRVYSLDAA
ncbi:MAG: metal-dependent hydrolase [Schumannella sp.]|nr:metal-dependent hydrolase [Schumannella sp.]